MSASSFFPSWLACALFIAAPAASAPSNGPIDNADVFEAMLNLAQRATEESDALGLFVAATALRDLGDTHFNKVTGGREVSSTLLFSEARALALKSGDRPLAWRIERTAKSASKGLISAFGRTGSLGTLRDLAPRDTLVFEISARGGEQALLRASAPGVPITMRVVDRNGRVVCAIEARSGEANCSWIPTLSATYTTSVTHGSMTATRIALISN